MRIVAATHRDLPKLIAEGKFREDLYYRLSSVILETAPLRARPDDIEPLVIHFTREVCKENGFDRSFRRRCLEVFREYSWKGNVRELRSVVERHLIGADSEIVRAEDLEALLYQKRAIEDPRTLEEIDRYLHEKKRQMMADVMKSSSAKAEAARRLDIAPNRLHYFTEKYGLDQK